MEAPKHLRYTKTHEWVREESGLVVVGITDFAQAQLSELTFVELPDVQDEMSAQDEAAVVESVKAASDIYAPLAGLVVEVNSQLANHPELVNSDPYGEGWLFKIQPTDLSDLDALLDADSYEDLVPDD